MSRSVDNYLATMESLYSLTHAEAHLPSKKPKKPKKLAPKEKAVARQVYDAVKHLPKDQARGVLNNFMEAEKGRRLNQMEFNQLGQKLPPSKTAPLLAGQLLEPQKTRLELENELFSLKKRQVEINQQKAGITTQILERINEIRPLLIKSWARLRNARIIDLPAEDMSCLYRVLNKHTQDADPDSLWKTIPYPERLPFQDVYFAFGDGLELPEPEDPKDESAQTIIDKQIDAPTITLGVLVTSDFAARIFRVQSQDEIYSNTWYEDGVWQQRSAPWVVTALVDLVNSYRTFVVEGVPTDGMRIKYRQAAKKFVVKRPIPQPYYTVKLESRTISSSVYRTGRWLSKYTIEFSHRFDVRGHERCKIFRDSKPLDKKTEKKLAQRGYEIFLEGNDPSDRLQKLLLERGEYPKAPKNGWLAVKLFWVQDHIKGPENKPYIPAVRVPSTNYNLSTEH